MEKEPVKKRTTKPKHEPKSIEVAEKCCFNLKKTLKSGSTEFWDTIGFGDTEHYCFQIRGLGGGNNIVITRTDSARKRYYKVALLSKQGTECEMPFEEFKYNKTDKGLNICFVSKDATLTHKVIDDEN